MRNSFKVSYVTTLPKQGNAPQVAITGPIPHMYTVEFHDLDKGSESLISKGLCRTNQTILAQAKQWFTKWGIKVTDESGKVVFTDVFDPINKVVFIKIDAWALGDTIAWIPFVEMFRLKHHCTVICSTFHNDLLADSFPDILFVAPNIKIDNVYAQYYVGASKDANPFYSPINVDEYPLQMAASTILGLQDIQLRADLTSKYTHIPSRFPSKYVTLSEFGSAPNKHWGVENGWQGVVDYLRTKGYLVVVVSKEKTSLTGVIDKSGDIPLDDRCVDILHADMHLGVSSGLSWLAWSLGTHVVMISDVTPFWHEFNDGITRLNANILERVNYSAESQTTLQEVIEKLDELGVW